MSNTSLSLPSISLVCRYQTDLSVGALLPGWIRERLVPPSQCSDFGKAFANLIRFFKQKQQQQQQA